MNNPYQLMPQLFLRAPFYGYLDYDLLRLPRVLADQYFRNAVWLASPVFYQALQKKCFEFDRLSDKEKHTLAKYYNRMCFRPTPFGAFASFSLLSWSDSGAVKLSGDEKARLHLLPDQHIVQGLNQCYRRGPDAHLVLNPVLYQAGKDYRFIRSVAHARGLYQYNLDTIEHIPFHQELIAALREKPYTVAELQQWIREQTGCAAGEAEDYVGFLRETQLVIGPERGHIITAVTDPFRDLALNVPAGADLPATGSNWFHALPVLEHQKDGPYFYAATERHLQEGCPDESTPAELARVTNMLARLSPSPEPSALTRFISAFSERYDREKVPILEALDNDTGIGYAELEAAAMPPLMDGLPFSRVDPEETLLSWEPVRQLLFRLWPRGGNSVLDISDQDLETLPPRAPETRAPSMSLIFRHTEEHLLIEHSGGATATALAGRFSVFSDTAHELCRKIALKEQEANPGVLFADIGQLSDTHADNVNRRRQIYDYEIPLNVYSQTPLDAQLRPDDLWLSVRDGELMLESARLGKRVIPRLPSAYNFRKSDLTIFRLLCDLQYHACSAPRSLDLEELFPGLQQYPRVCYGRTILAPAKWHIGQQDIDLLRSLGPAKYMEGIRTLRNKYGLPRRVSTGTEDQQLVFDLAQAEEVAFLINCLKPGEPIKFLEYLLPDRSVRKGIDPLAGQFIAFMYHDGRAYRPVIAQDGKGNVPPVTRDFPPGSEWLYLKLYCTPFTADKLLSEVIAATLDEAGSAVSSWFFIRYNDPRYHLRLRFRIHPELGGALLAILRRSLEKAGYDQMVGDFQAGTYQRELERYGPGLIGQAEELFHLGSLLFLRALDPDPKEPEACPPFRLALLCASAMIGIFYQAEGSAVFCQKVAESMLQNYRGQKNLRTEMDKKYRQQKKDVEKWLKAGTSGLPAELAAPLNAILEQTRLIYDLSVSDGPGRQSALLADLVHMQLNRFFSTHTRELELLTYYCLHLYKTSERARQAAGSI
ncbi:hypothetical protein BEL04_08585 [Mucilaginibacter sp. PPCGB 2223]|uniref:lantibiotic dehydratase n=1 Tax=Mucilaginibacter sp. PPCGB 2223 TaxID=1886027 RepID=UPI0008261D2D|nr:lantibiotic dehydratase [Mucilaginibacter sp. PPCGB 2223]OCX54305.1 hypothetical protein BEL04_08585 [Mucilaginibacter sp. PPCGB 2223]